MRKKEHFPGAFLNTAFPTILVFLCMLTLLYFAHGNKIISQKTNITMVKITAVVYCSFQQVSHSQPILLWQISKAPLIVF